MPPQDPGKAYRGAARSSAYRYESLLRRRAPYRMGGASGGPCDEIIGRFCFTFSADDGPDPPPEPEHEDIDEARRVAVRAHRRWLSADPGDTEAAGGLVRYLIAGGRAPEAVPLARAHAWAAGRTPESLLLLGLALHYTGDFRSAEAVFDSARAAVPAEERGEWDDVEVLLEPGERGRYRRLSPSGREAYARRFWALSDPSLLDEGNERRSAHYARRAWIQILSRAPRVQGMLPWGRDYEEIVLRYGLPTTRERIRQPAWKPNTDLRMVETFDPHAVSFVPAELGKGLPGAPSPGTRPVLERDTARSMYAPVRLHRMRGMDPQASRLPDPGGALLWVVGVLPPDTVAPSAPLRPRGVLAVLDTMGREVARVPADVRVGADSSTVVSGRVRVAPGSYVYTLEIADDSTGLAGLARYPITVPEPDGLVLGDLVIAVPAAGGAPGRDVLEPAPRLVLHPQDVLVYTEAEGLRRGAGRTRYAVEWWLEPLDRGSMIGRAARWLGRRLGLVGRDRPVRVRWEDGSAAPGPTPVAFTLDLRSAEPGLYRLHLAVHDRLADRSATSTRVIRIDPGADPLPGRGPG